MYRSDRPIERKTTSILRKRLEEFLVGHGYITCMALNGRRVFLSKLPEAITQRRDMKGRLMCFWVGIDIVKKSNEVTQKVVNKKKQYEICGLSAEGKLVFVHLREEVQNKDKRLFLISTYYKQ